MSYREFYEDIKNKTLAPLYVLHGTEKLLIDSMLSLVQTKCLDQNLVDFNYVVKEAGGMSFDEAYAMIETLPVMDERRVVVLRSPSFLTKAEWTDDQVEAFINFHTKSEGLTSILVVDGLDKRKKVYKTLSKSHRVIAFDRLNERDLFKWIGQEFKKAGKTIENRALTTLVERTGYLNKDADIDLYGIQSLIHRLQHAHSGQEIGLVHVEDLLKSSVEANIFAYTDALFEGKAKLAFKQLNALLDHGEVPIKLMFMVQRHLRQLIKVKTLLDEGFSSQAMASTLGLKPFVVKKSINQANRLSLNRLTQLLFKAQEADLNMKSSLDPQIVLEVFMGEVLRTS